jgi:hypothetical protein
MRVRTFWRDLGWLVVLVVTFAVPLALDAVGRLSYVTSLCFWAIPIAYLWPLFRQITAGGAETRRRALAWSVGSIVVLGIALDFVFGRVILQFAAEGCPPNLPRQYVLCLPAFGGAVVPIEELFFYAMGPVAIVLVYACADEAWLRLYNPPDDLLDARLIQISPGIVATAIAGLLAAALFTLATGRIPAYYLFLLAGALLPAMFFYRCVGSMVNWPAFALTTLYVIVTSVVWEVTLAIPRGWWGYREAAMILEIGAWSAPGRPFPIEAAFVWLCASFSSVLVYEFLKAFFAHPLPVKAALFGRPRPR